MVDRNYEFKFQRGTLPYRAFATWNIHYACNYKCTYCHAPKPEQKDTKKVSYISGEKWLNIWSKIYDKYGTWEILISGGEPFVYPGFMELLLELSKIHIISVCTNLEWDVTYFIKYADAKRIKIETSFHPEFAELDKFSEKLKLLKENGFLPTVNFVPWPPFLSKIQEIKEKIESVGCILTLQPFIGTFSGREYPQGYTEEERGHFRIFNDECNLKTLGLKTTSEANSTKGRLCRMGQNYVYLHPDGQTSRCCRDHSFSLGNIIDGSFKLLEEAAICNAHNCNCWRAMLVDKEDFWWRHWGRYEITDLAMSECKKNMAKDFRIALLQPPVWGIYEPPVALAQLSSCLKSAAFKVSVFDLNIELYHQCKDKHKNFWAIEQSSFWANKDNVEKFFQEQYDFIEDYLNKIIASSPQVVGFSVNVCSLPATIELAKRLKYKIPEVKIVLGGPIFFLDCDAPSLLKNDCIDIIVQSEAEETFCELAQFLSEAKELRLCRGIYFKNEGGLIKTETRPLIKNLDTLPFLDLESFPLEKYDAPGHLGKHISLMTTRGCILNCAYCGPKAYWKGFRSMSGKRIYEEIKYHLEKRPEIEHIEFLDLELNGSIDSLAEFCDLMLKAPLKNGLYWHANIVIRPEMTKELLSKMKEAGCWHLSIGIESGSQRILDLMRKRYRIDDAQNLLRYAHEAGIHITTNFMFGFPGENEDDFNHTLDFLRRNANFIGTVYPSRSFFTIEPFSYIARHLDEFGIVANPDNNLYWESSDGQNNYPERLRRCEEFSQLASQLNVPIGLGLQTSLELDRYYNLGFYYKSKKDFVKAGDYFKQYLQHDPQNTLIKNELHNLTSVEPAFTTRSSGNGKISFNWDITSVCNYRCPYCWFYGKWTELKKNDVRIPVDTLKRFWEKIYNQYGSVKVFITGGEPFLYPDFIDLISNISNWHKVEIVTNLSWSARGIVERIANLEIKIHPSFHPLFANFEEFLDKLIILREKKLADNPSYVAWPPQISLLKHYAKQFKDYGIDIFAQTFYGEYKGRKYPDSYSDVEKELIRPFLGERGGKPFQTETKRTKGKLCYAGSLYGVIHADGNVLRCGGLNSEDAKVGNILEEDFTLLQGASLCTSEICPCNEWASLLKEEIE